jgi:hypothetical protein
MPWWVGVLIFGGLLLLVGIGVGGFLWWGASNNQAEKELLTSAQTTPCPATYSCKPIEHRKTTYQMCSAPLGTRYGGGDVVFLTGAPNRVAAWLERDDPSLKYTLGMLAEIRTQTVDYPIASVALRRLAQLVQAGAQAS